MADREIMPESEIKEAETSPPAVEQPLKKESSGSGGGGGWGGWGFSPLSYLSDLQKAAADAAEEISRNAVEAAKTAANAISEMQPGEDSESSKKDGADSSAGEEESEDGNDKRRKEALAKLENASEDSIFGQGLKVFDNKVENFASGAWQALGNAFKGGSTLVSQLEDSALSFAESTPSIIEGGKSLTAKGMQVLEFVGKETLDLLISETGMDGDKKSRGSEGGDEDQFLEEATFDRCFYIYGGPEQLEELEALSSHYALLFNRRKAKLSTEQKSVYDGKLKQVQQVFDLTSEFDGGHVDSEKGKETDAGFESSVDDMKTLHDSSVKKAAELAAGFANTLAGQAPSDIVQRSAGRLDSLHSESVHRMSEMCCFAVTHLLMLAKSIISSANKAHKADDDDIAKVDWPEDSVEKAKIIRTRAHTMCGLVDAVSKSFITGISDVAEAYLAAMKVANSESHEALPKVSIQEKATAFSENLRADHSTAVAKIQDGIQHLSYLVVSTSMPAAA